VTAPVFDPVVHAPNRLQLCALLAPVETVEFATLRASLGVSDSVLSKHLRVLEEAGYVRLTKATVNGRVRTRAALTTAGRAAFDGHLAELRRLTAGLVPDQPR
jgi:DNA-binding MarR family transcriptional regulator